MLEERLTLRSAFVIKILALALLRIVLVACARTLSPIPASLYRLARLGCREMVVQRFRSVFCRLQDKNGGSHAIPRIVPAMG